MSEGRKISDSEWRQLALPTTDGAVREGSELPSGRERRADPHKISYREYLCLDDLLSAQRPLTDVPDERIFITTHQKAELAFKDMLADCELLRITFDDLRSRVADGGLSAIPDKRYWSTPLTAAHRLCWIATQQLPAIFAPLDFHSEGETFDSVEFARFRPALIGASGFQSAQFRAIQIALGKKNLFGIRLIIDWSAEERRWKLLPIADPDAVRDQLPPECPLDESVQGFLAEAYHHLKSRGKVEAQNASLPSPDKAEIVKNFAAHLDTLAMNIRNDVQNGFLTAEAGQSFTEQRGKMLEGFENSLNGALGRERDRLEGQENAASAAAYLFDNMPDAPLTTVLKALRKVESAIHGPDKQAFLGWHLPLVGRRISEVNRAVQQHGLRPQPAGTGGQGGSYLAFMHRWLIPLFPAFVQFPPYEVGGE